MTRRFRITIGGVTYNVEVEEVGAPSGVAAAPQRSTPAPTYAAPSAPAPAFAPSPAQVPASPAPAPAAPAPMAAAPAAPSTGGGQEVKAPLPGQIVEVKVAVGQQVSVGETLLVLEAMKMENDIASPFAGTVKQILVTKGASVSLNDLLVVIA